MTRMIDMSGVTVVVRGLALAIFLSWGVAQAKSIDVLHSFAGGSDGESPYGGLILDKTGNLYGTTYFGGGTGCSPYDSGCGTIFKVDTSGAESVLYVFSGLSDGAFPNASLIEGKKGEFYGTAQQGGANYWGVVFEISTTGVESTLYSFAGGKDGGSPEGALLAYKQGNLYGTTYNGGGSTACVNGCGTVFQLTPPAVKGGAWTERVIYAFQGGNDGAGPSDGLVEDKAGDFYGTTQMGGNFSCSYAQGVGCGTVFKIASDGAESLLHSFAGPPDDGGTPWSGLTADRNGVLYGTTVYGGENLDCSSNHQACGTVYEITPDGSETVLHSFDYTKDGAYPFAGVLLDGNGDIYGATYNGGYYGCGCGTIFKLAPDGKVTRLFVFADDGNGASPAATPIADAMGNLYGTTVGGGNFRTCNAPFGCGTVYKLKK